MKTSAQGGSDTVAQLKQDIHVAQAGESVAVHDLGVSPLGTDDEAGGHSPLPEEIALARRQEASTSKAALRADPSSGVAKKVWPIVAMMALVGVVVLVVMAKVIGGI
ncbi:hypothetical protein [Lichenifustis flavocetrariae]|uniref:Uncharacterized protein n=1 Tax=Lichenifustis flavocetrariae TaxID=2949735 RepID=A0AA41YYM9_9HYPH|nr:hypothetical protein [Lichenifustis flavocetrariae]MCW6509701.1 hypothetical protein [Lichenifustis flavocetrariae]